MNQLDFDIALQTVFESRAAHDAYQLHPRHIQFIEENKPNLERVRVFDADVTQHGEHPGQRPHGRYNPFRRSLPSARRPESS